MQLLVFVAVLMFLILHFFLNLLVMGWNLYLNHTGLLFIVFIIFLNLKTWFFENCRLLGQARNGRGQLGFLPYHGLILSPYSHIHCEAFIGSLIVESPGAVLCHFTFVHTENHFCLLHGCYCKWQFIVLFCLFETGFLCIALDILELAL